MGILLVDGPAGSTGSIGSSIKLARSACTFSRLGTTTDLVDSTSISENDTGWIVEWAWSFAHLLHDDSLSYVACTEQITFLMFPKLAHERTQPPRNRPPGIPGGLDTG